MTGPQAAVDPAGSPHNSFPHRRVHVTPAAHQKLAGQARSDDSDTADELAAAAEVETATREHFGRAYAPPGGPIDGITKLAQASFRAGYVIARAAALGAGDGVISSDRRRGV